MTRPAHLAFALVSLFAITHSIEASDWPGFRGPMSCAITLENDFPVQWAKDPFLWKIKLPGPGAASPITWGDKVFVVCYTGYAAKVLAKDVDKGKANNAGDQKKLRRVIMCVDSKTGQVLWQQEVEAKLPEQAWGEMISEHGYASNTPVTDGENVYVFFGKTGVYAFDFAGKKLWQADVGSGTFMYGSAASLALHKNLVIVNASAESKMLLALDKATGNVVWRNKEITATWASPAVVLTKEGNHELVLCQPNKIVAYEPETGKELWRCQGLPIPPGGSAYCTPVSKDGILYFAGGGGPGSTAMALAVKAGGRGDVTKTHVLWRVKAGTNVNSPAMSGDYVYCIDGFVTCLRADTGKQVYKERLYESPREYCSPVIAGDKIFMLTRFDGMHVLATGERFQTLAHNAFADDKSVFNASPAFSNGRIYVRSNAYLYSIGKP